jgi:putative cardiolipin synthase
VIKDHAYQLRLSEMGSVQWIERSAGKEIVHDQEPGADVWRILSVDFFSLLPIEWLL